MSYINEYERNEIDDYQTGKVSNDQINKSEIALPSDVNELHNIILTLEKDLSKSRTEVFKLNEQWK